MQRSPGAALPRRRSPTSRSLRPELCSTIIPIYPRGGRYYHIIPRYPSRRHMYASIYVCVYLSSVCMRVYVNLTLVDVVEYRGRRPYPYNVVRAVLQRIFMFY